MPTYDYRCKKCGHRFELYHSIKDDAPKRCPKCRSRAERVPSSGAGLLFKGSGFYITDYRSDSYKEKAKTEKPAAATSSGEKSGGSGEPSAGKSGDSGSKSRSDSAGKSSDSAGKSKKKKGD